MIVTYAGPGGRQVILTDANPGIGGLGVATPLTLEEFRSGPAAAPQPRPVPEPMPASKPGPVPEPRPVPEPGGRNAGRGTPPGWRSGEDRPPPNLGPPPARLDWRRRRS
jgi:hypothetical protein